MTLGISTKSCKHQTSNNAYSLSHWLGIVVIFVFLLALGWNSAKASAKDFHSRLHQLKADRWDENDVAKEIKIGREISARILRKYNLLNNLRLTNYVSLVGTSLTLHSQRSELRYHFSVLDDQALNAYSAPGGYVFISKGLLDFIGDESELAGILAHEIMHISQRHIVNALNIKGSSQEELSSLARFIGASAGTTSATFSQTIDKAMSTLFDSGYEKEQELQADKDATLLLANTGYDPSGLLRVLQRIEDKNSDKISPSVTHPSFSKRFDRLRILLTQETLVPNVFKRARLRYETHVKKTSVKGFTPHDFNLQ